jgi:iron complex outermembrane recepter protein
MKFISSQRTPRLSVIDQKLLPLAIALVYSVSVAADDSFVIEEIFVTAQKRAESVQDVPISISAMSADFVRNVGAQTVDGLGIYTPGLETRVSEVTQPQLSIRGITTSDFGIGADPAVAVYVDGVYSGRSASALTAFQDLERVEVLKGPQGTLFGKNAAAGAIHLISKKPTQVFEAEMSAGVGNYGKRKIEAVVNLPLTDDLALRITAMDNQRDGYRDNLFNGEELANENSGGARASLLWNATDETDVLAQVEYYNVDQDGSVYTSLLHGDSYGDARLDFTPKETLELWGGAVTVESGFERVLFTSITALKRFESSNLIDYDGTDLFTTTAGLAPYYLVGEHLEENNFFSQEFRLTSQDDSALRWTLGAMYSREHGKQDSPLTLSTNVVNVLIGADLLPTGELFRELASGELNSTSAALYGDMTYALNDVLGLTVGLRYTHDEKDYELTTVFNPLTAAYGGFGVIYPVEFKDGVEQEDSWSNVSSRVVLDYAFAEDTMVYLSYATGYKAGGFNSTRFTQPVDEEQVTNIELGLKSTWLDSRLRFNAAVYDYDYEDLQAYAEINAQQVIRNEDAEGQGFEMDLTWAATRRLTLSANYNYLDTKITAFQLFEGETAADDRIGKPLINAAEQTYNLGMEYELPMASVGELVFRVDYSYIGERDFPAITAFDAASQTLVDDAMDELEGDYDNVNARITYLNTSENWRVSLYGQNLTDEKYIYLINKGGAEMGSPSTRRANPRLYGLDVSYRF